MRIKQTIAAVIFGLAVSVPNVFATGYPVFDISGWLTAIDQLYTEYDMVMNTIMTIENQYTQIQQAVERAKNIDWDNISFDDDFDIRNDIRDANRRVNRLLNQARTIKNTLTSPSIDCGYGRYSIADLCGMNGAEHNFFAATNMMGNYMTDTMSSTIKNIEEGLTKKQRIAIWSKYGISPKNYLFVQQSVSKVQESAAKVMSKATDEAVQLQREEKIAKTNTIIEAAYSQTDSDGNMTDAASKEASLYLSQQMIDELMELQESINDMASLQASKMIAEENQKQAEADEMAAEQRRQDAFDSKVPDAFRK